MDRHDDLYLVIRHEIHIHQSPGITAQEQQRKFGQATIFKFAACCHFLLIKLCVCAIHHIING